MVDLLDRFRSIPVASHSDSLSGMDTLDSGIRTLASGFQMAEPALTVLTEAGSVITVQEVLLEARPGALLVVGGESSRGLDGHPLES